MNDIGRRHMISVILLIVAVAMLSTAACGCDGDTSVKLESDIGPTPNVEAAAQAYYIHTIYVPDDLPTIQAALDEAAAVYAPLATVGAAADVYTWTTVIVRNGVYTGPDNKNLDFKGFPTTLMSENGPENCIINCEGDGRGFNFHSGETSYSVLDGFTIANGEFWAGEYPDGGAGIRCDSYSSPVIANCIIKDSIAFYAGGGILCKDHSSPSIINCTISGNSAGTEGGGIACFDGSSPSIDDCTITRNVSSRGGGLYFKMSSATITNCNISDNVGSQRGGGIHPGYRAIFTITNCTLTGNTAGKGAGMAVSGATGTITNSILSGNFASKEYSELYLVGNVFHPTTVAVNYSDVAKGKAGVRVELNGTLNWGSGNIAADPLFVSPGYWDGDVWVDGDYHLTAGSPCIDAGTDAGVYTDIDGDSRPGGAGFDMGSDEY